jgi:predicted transcriptional regulator
MKYTKKTLDNFLEKVMMDCFSSEVALINYRDKLEELQRKKEKVSSKSKKAKKNLEELEAKKKEGIKDKELREQNKELIKIVSEKFQNYVDEYTELLGHENHMKEKIGLYEDFLETADESIKIAKEMTGNKV